jgi:hypothetical protein
LNSAVTLKRRFISSSPVRNCPDFHCLNFGVHSRVHSTTPTRLPHCRKYWKFPLGCMRCLPSAGPPQMAVQAGSANCANPCCLPPCDATRQRDQRKTVSGKCGKCGNSPADRAPRICG